MPTTKKTAKQKKDAAKLPARAAAEVVLLNNGKPMHYREISRVAIETGIVKVKRGATPEATMKTVRSYLAGAVKDGDDRFVRVDEGVFNLTRKGKAHARKIVKATEQETASG